MIDTHAHIIYDVDDGSESQEMTQAMLRLAAQKGTKAMWATPHVIDAHDKLCWKEILHRTEEVQKLAHDMKLDLTIYPAAEVMMNWDLLPELGKDGAYCVGSEKYMLVELPMHEIPRYAEDFWYELRLKGVVPILAHPERYVALMDNLPLLVKWRHEGLILQVNSGSISGKFGKKIAENAKRLLACNVVDLLGSDAHTDRSRNTDMSVAVSMMEELVGKERTLRIVEENPKLIMAGKELVLSDGSALLKPTKKSFWQKLFG